MPRNRTNSSKPTLSSRISRRTAVIGGTASVGVLAAAYFGCNPLQLSTRTPPKKTAEKAPDFDLPSQFGKSVTLKRLSRHRPVAIVFYRGFW